MDTTKLTKLMQDLVAGGPWIFVKVMFLAGLFVYLMFGIIIVRQSQLMNETIEAKHNEIVKLMAWMHLGLTIFILFVAVVML